MEKYTKPPRQKKPLGEILAESGAISREALDEVLAEGRNGRFGEFLVERGLVSSDEVARALASQAGLPFRKLKGTDVDPCVLPLAPVTLISAKRILPLWQEGDLLHVATPEPKDYDTLQELEYRSHCRPRPWVTARERVDRLIEYHIPYGPGFPRPLPHNLAHPVEIHFVGKGAPAQRFKASLIRASFGGALVQIPPEPALQGLVAVGIWTALLSVPVGEQHPIAGICGLSVVESWDDGTISVHLDYVGITREAGRRIYDKLAVVPAP